MAIMIRCASCTRTFKVEDELADTVVACPDCGAVQLAPIEESPSSPVGDEFGQPSPRCRVDVAKNQSAGCLIVSTGLIVGIVGVVVAGVLIFVASWATGGMFNPGMVAHRRPAPMTLEAAAEALLVTYVVLIFIGLPIFVVGAVVGAVVAAKRARVKPPPATPS